MKPSRRGHRLSRLRAGSRIALGWLVLMVVVFDLAGSPLHPHAHDLGASAMSLHPLHEAGSDETVHLALDDDLTLGHSLNLLRMTSPQAATAPDSDEGKAAARPVPIVDPADEPATRFRSPVGPQPPPDPAHARPASRAPPLLPG